MATEKSVGPGLLVGCGRMGQRHLKHLNLSPNVGTFYLVDPQHPDLGSLAGRQAGYFTSLESALEVKPAWAVVAVSTPAHFAVAVSLLERGVAVLMEKPLAPTPEECSRLISLAQKHDAPLYVGHVERFNPVVFALGSFLRSGTPGKIHSLHLTRWGAAPAEVQSGNNVVVDLSVHDIDILHSFGFVPKLVKAQGLRAPIGHVDHLEALLELDSDTNALLSTSWRSPVRKRTIRALCEKGIVEADLIAQALTWEGASIDLPVIVPAEPLGAQLESFLEAIANKKTLSCTAHEGARAIELAAEMTFAPTISIDTTRQLGYLAP